MKNTLILSLVIVAFATGYFTGKLQGELKTHGDGNSVVINNETSLYDTNLQAGSVSAEKANSPSTSSFVTTPSNAPESSTFNSSPVRDGQPSVNASTITNETAVVETKARVEKRDDAQNNFSLAQQELSEWQARHKQNLKERMQEALGESADFMFEQVSSNSPLLLETNAISPLEEDLSWRYRAEKAITDYILSNATDPLINILQVACIQQKCEVTLTGSKQPAAFALYGQLTSAKPFDLQETSTPTIFTNDDGSYWLYVVLSFS